MTVSTLNSVEAQRVCTLSGVQRKRLNGTLVVLADGEKMLVAAIADVTRAHKDESFWRAMEVSAKIVSLSCDLAIGLMEEAASKMGAPVGARSVSAIYDVSKLVVDAFNGDLGVAKAAIYNANIKADVLSEMLSRRSPSAATAVGRVKMLANLAYELWDFVDRRGTDLSSVSGLVGARRTAVAQLARVRQQIAETRSAIDVCL